MLQTLYAHLTKLRLSGYIIVMIMNYLFCNKIR